MNNIDWDMYLFGRREGGRPRAGVDQGTRCLHLRLSNAATKSEDIDLTISSGAITPADVRHLFDHCGFNVVGGQIAQYLYEALRELAETFDEWRPAYEVAHALCVAREIAT